MSGAYLDDAYRVLAPTSSRRQVLSGTGSTQANLSSDLTRTARVVLVVQDDAAVILEFGAGGSNPTVGTAANSLKLPAGAIVAFNVDDNSQRVSAEAADGTSAFRVDVWEASAGPHSGTW